MKNPDYLRAMKCQGSFCTLLKGVDLFSHNYDDERILEKFKRNLNADRRESLVLKLDRELEKLNKSKDEIRKKDVSYIVPYKYILLGKFILKDSSLEEVAEKILNNDPVELKHKHEVVLKTLQMPTKCYESFKVCQSCFEVYSMLMKNFQRVSGEVKNIKQSVQFSNYFNSELGPINKDNLDDLLVDIRYNKVSNKRKINDSMKRQFESMTEFNSSNVLKEKDVKIRKKVVKVNTECIFKNLERTQIADIKKGVFSKVSQFYMTNSFKPFKRIVIKRGNEYKVK